MLRSLFRFFAAVFVTGLLATPAWAQSEYPARPITLIVAFAAGGPTDVPARIVSEHMSRTLGQRIIVENVLGAGGTVGTTRAMRANPDGYTIVMGQFGTHAAAVALYPNLAYNPEIDFAPIGQVTATHYLVVARKDFPPKDLKEFVSYVKANAEKVNTGHAGVGSVGFTTCLLLNSILGVKPTSVPFSGAGPAMNSLIAGQIDYMCDSIVNSIPQLQGGTIKAYAISAAQRSPVLPNVPTSTEAGLPEFQVMAWNALFAPKATPKFILDKLTDALNKALDDPIVRKRLLDLGADIPDKAGRGQQALGALVKSDIAKWTPIIKAANVKGE